MTDWQRSRLIPTSGIGSAREAESRAASALLSVVSVVRPFSKALLDSLGAPRAARAVVDCYIEVPFDHGGRQVRPDGLIRVSYGRRKPWTALVEVKTREAALDADQVNAYWRIATDQRYDAVITISNEIARTAGVHPTEGLKVRANSRVKVHHWSWTSVLAEAVVQKVHRGVDDPEQAWILGELIRYLEHPNSGALTFSDMGAEWAEVRDGVRDGTITKRHAGIDAVCQRWDQLIRFAALTLGSEIGEDVQQVLTRLHRTDQRRRAADLVERLASNGMLEGTLRVPNTAGDIDLVADLRGRQVTATMTVEAPHDRGSRARISWLIRQLAGAPGTTIIAAWTRLARQPAAIALLSESRDNPAILLDPSGKDIVRFDVTRKGEMGRARKSGARAQGFVESVLTLATKMYGEVVQNVQPWVPRAPKLKPHPVEKSPAGRAPDPPAPPRPARPDRTDHEPHRPDSGETP